MSTTKRILLTIDWFVPGYKAGGPIQSCKNIVENLSEEAEWYILCSDRDLGDTEAYPGVVLNTWQAFAPNVKVLYAAPGFLTQQSFRRIMGELQPEIVYINSMFSKNFAILPLFYLRRMAYQGKIILAPRGMLFSDAVARKGLKKKVFLQAFKWFLLDRKHTSFHATNEQEKSDILQHLGNGLRVDVVENLPNIAAEVPHRNKQPGEIRCVCMARIHPTKNLRFTLEAFLQWKPKGKILLDVYGVTDDKAYLETCAAIMAQLPANVEVYIHEALPHQQVFDTLARYHAFVMPTLGENFGHAIFEALSSGCPVLISDQTPWRQLATQQAGWDLPLNTTAPLIAALDTMLAMDQAAYDQWSAGARAYAMRFIEERQLKSRYQKLFS